MPGTYALLGTGIWALNRSGLARLLALGTLTDAYVIAKDGGGAQVVVTTSLMDGRRYIMRRTSAYYIDGADFAHYATNAPTADLPVPPERSGEPPPVRSLSVVEE